MATENQEQILDELVIGAGLYGSRLALKLSQKGRSVRLIEREAEVLCRASTRNQLRVHNGYHYPRSFLTAARSQNSYARFRDEFAECIVHGHTHFYAIAAADSKVSNRQFIEFCNRVGIPLRSPRESAAARAMAKRFRRGSIEQVFEVEESCYDPVKLRTLMKQQLAGSSVELRLGTQIEEIEQTPTSRWRLTLRSQAGGLEHIQARRIWNCTYAGLDEIRAQAKLQSLGIRQERAELCVIESPEGMESSGLTVMCGPFFSILPMVGYGGREHTLSHVRYTPHMSESTFELMKRDCLRFMPEAENWVLKRSLLEYKALLPASDFDDGRPILWHEEPKPSAPFFSVLGGKLDNVFEIEQELEHTP